MFKFQNVHSFYIQIMISAGSTVQTVSKKRHKNIEFLGILCGLSEKLQSIFYQWIEPTNLLTRKIKMARITEEINLVGPFSIIK